MEKAAITTSTHFTPRATLAAIGLKLRAIDLFGPISQGVAINQKTVKYSPADKLYDAFITILAGAHGISEINTRLRTDKALQRSFGREACAEQSVVQETLNHCTSTNVAQLMQAVDHLFRQHSLAYHHDYRASLQLLDIDITGLPCGVKAEFATKGYFIKQDHSRRGRQMGRILATHYEEVVADRLYPGNCQLPKTLRYLVETAEATLELAEEKRRRTILRVDAGGGSFDDINWMLERGYQVHCKDYSSQRAKALATTVQEWVHDPRIKGRQLGWVHCDTLDYLRPVVRVAARWHKKQGRIGYGVVVSTLTPEQIIHLLGWPVDRAKDPNAVLRAYAYFYDLRGGGVEEEIKEDKHGLGITRRSKKRFEAQQMVMFLGTLAHNVVVWARRWLSPDVSRLARYGVLRLVRDVFQLTGFVQFNAAGGVIRVVLNQASPLAKGLKLALARLLAREMIVIQLDET